MPEVNPIKIADQIRRVVQAIIDGRIEAKEVVSMTDDQLAEYNAKLESELDDAINEGEQLSSQ